MSYSTNQPTLRNRRLQLLRLLAQEREYSCPMAFLPALSVIPAAAWTKQAHGGDKRWGEALQRMSEAATEVARRWQQQSLSTNELTRNLAELAETLATVALSLPVNHAAARQQVSAGHRLDPAHVAQRDVSAVMAAACAIYDRYFQVERVHPMGFDLFVAQVTETMRHLLQDLPNRWPKKSGRQSCPL